MEIYLDANATTPVLPQAKAAAIQAMVEAYGNPSSVHCTGLKARALMDDVRALAQRLLDTGSGRLLFVSGATEGIQTAVLSALNALRERREAGETIGAQLLYGATEHKAVPEALRHWNAVLGLDLAIREIPVDRQGRHDLAFVRAEALSAGLVCTMAANNETGVISDLAGIETALDASGSRAYWMVDGVQALGKLPLRLSHTRIDYAPFSGHKLYAPKGIGLLYVRDGAPFTPLMAGGGQEGALRSGTENMSGIAALGAVLAALENTADRTFRTHAELTAFRDRLAAALRAAFPGMVFNAPLELSLPTTLNFSVPGLGSRVLQDLFDAADVRVSGGSACSSAKAAPSFVLQAMGLPDWQTEGAVRMSIGPAVDEAFIAEACARIEACGESLRRHCMSPTDNLPSVGDGLSRFMAGGACCYLLADASSRRCVLIDPLPEQVSRLAQVLRCQSYQLSAVLSSSGDPAHAAARRALCAELPDLMDATDAIDGFGWPQGRSELDLGSRRLRRVSLDRGGQACLLWEGEGRAQCSVAFVAPEDAEALADRIGPQTLIAPPTDEAQMLCTIPGRVGVEDHDAPCLQLPGAQLQQFADAHPDAILVDVREPYEQFLSHTPDLAGMAMEAVPLSRILNAIPGWLVAQRPLLFFCRSGNRSRQAAQALARLGHRQAWTLAGGLALLPEAPATIPAAAADAAVREVVSA